jgi:hypothetical protein
MGAFYPSPLKTSLALTLVFPGANRPAEADAVRVSNLFA